MVPKWEARLKMVYHLPEFRREKRQWGMQEQAVLREMEGADWSQF
jgi:hypothetical protein